MRRVEILYNTYSQGLGLFSDCGTSEGLGYRIDHINTEYGALRLVRCSADADTAAAVPLILLLLVHVAGAGLRCRIFAAFERVIQQYTWWLQNTWYRMYQGYTSTVSAERSASADLWSLFIFLLVLRSVYTWRSHILQVLVKCYEYVPGVMIRDSRPAFPERKLVRRCLVLGDNTPQFFVHTTRYACAYTRTRIQNDTCQPASGTRYVRTR